MVKRHNVKFGHAFERRVADAFARNGYAQLRKNHWMYVYDSSRDSASKREFDLVLFSMPEKRFCIVECKAHYTRDVLVPAVQVQEFHSKLKNHPSKGAHHLMVTDNSFTKSAEVYASQSGIKLMDGRALERLDYAGNAYLRIRSKACSFLMKKADYFLDELISSYF